MHQCISIVTAKPKCVEAVDQSGDAWSAVRAFQDTAVVI